MDTIYADSLGSVAPPGKDPVFGSKRPNVRVMHITSVPPVPNMCPKEALSMHYAFRDRVLSNQGTHAVLSWPDVDKQGSIGFLFGMQHMPSDMTHEHLRGFYDAGVRVMALAYQGANEYGSGFAVPLGGITRRGRQVIRMMSEVGIILDLSHANQHTAEQALDFIGHESLPIRVMASHSASHAVYPHARNITDYHLREIVYRDGYIGIPAITFMLTQKLKDGSYLEAFARHVTYVFSVCGNKVGIGSDCVHGNMTMLEASNHFEQMSKILNGGGVFRAYFPDRPPEVITHGEEMFSIFDTALKGLVSDVRAGILGKNFIAFLRRSLPRT